MSQRQFLPLDEGSHDCEQEFNLISMSAMDYLKQVRFERKKIPQVVTVHPLRNSEAIASEADEKLGPKKADHVRSHAQNTTLEWKNIWSSKFSKIQQRIIKIRKFPWARSEDVQLDLSDKISCVNFCKSNDPKLSTILTLDQGQLEELMEIFSSTLKEIIKDPGFQAELTKHDWITKWIYALLACLRTPLDPDVHNCLRMIAKSCITVTSRIAAHPVDSDHVFLPWNLIIIVIAINFQQFDILNS